MKTSLEQDDIQIIVSAVVEALKPMLSGNGKQDAGDVVFDKKGVAEYLKVSVSVIDKMVSKKEIPHFKIQPGQSGGVRFFRKDIDRWISRRTIPDVNPLQGR